MDLNIKNLILKKTNAIIVAALGSKSTYFENAPEYFLKNDESLFFKKLRI